MLETLYKVFLLYLKQKYLFPSTSLNFHNSLTLSQIDLLQREWENVLFLSVTGVSFLIFAKIPHFTISICLFTLGNCHITSRYFCHSVCFICFLCWVWYFNTSSIWQIKLYIEFGWGLGILKPTCTFTFYILKSSCAASLWYLSIPLSFLLQM